MKLTLKEFKVNFKKNYLFIISLVVTITLCFMIISSQMILHDKKNIYYKNNISYSFYDINTNADNIKELLDDERVEQFYLFYDLDINYNSKEKQQIINDINNSILLKKNYEYSLPKGKIPSIDSDEDIIAIPTLYALLNEIDIGDQIDFFGTKLKVVGYTDMTLFDSFVTNLGVIEKMNLKPSTIEIDPNNNLNDFEVKNLVEDLSKKVNSTNYETSISEALDLNESLRFILSVIITLSMLSLLFVFTHILNTRKNKYFIFRFNGMTKLQFYKMLLFEIITTYIISFGIALLLFYVYDSIILEKIFKINRYNLKLSSIYTIFTLYLIILIIFMFINIRKYFNKSLVESYKKG